MVHDGDPLQKCPVCSEDFPNVPFGKTSLKNHYWQKHAEFPAWKEREAKKLILYLSPAVVVLIVLLLYLGPSSQESTFYVVAGYVAFSGLLTTNMIYKGRGYKRRWVEEHAVPNDLL